jgi:hypothetical protein
VARPPAAITIEYCRSCGKLWYGDDQCCKRQDRVPLRYARTLSDRELEGYLGGAWLQRGKAMHDATGRQA